jgi:hypothetical protein
VHACPRCGTPVEPGQEYCLGCGARLPGRGGAFGARKPVAWVPRAAAALVAAAGAAALAIAAGDGRSSGAGVVTATGEFATVPQASTLPAETPSSGTAGWPTTEDGWTIVLASVPQAEGRRPAALRAREARKRGIRRVGVLDSSSYASLHPGYWVVFTCIYTSEAEATSELEQARRFARTATVRRIVR